MKTIFLQRCSKVYITYCKFVFTFTVAYNTFSARRFDIELINNIKLYRTMNPNCGRHQATMQLNEDVRIVRGNRNAHGRYAYIQQYWHFVEHNIARPQITVS